LFLVVDALLYQHRACHNRVAGNTTKHATLSPTSTFAKEIDVAPWQALRNFCFAGINRIGCGGAIFAAAAGNGNFGAAYCRHAANNAGLALSAAKAVPPKIREP